MIPLVAEGSVWMSTKQASAYLGVNLRTLYRFIDEGGLPAFKFGRVIGADCAGQPRAPLPRADAPGWPLTGHGAGRSSRIATRIPRGPLVPSGR
jgi:excisionase family DNA binding protein